MHSRLSDKVAIVTGSSSGLGRAIAIAYAREGAILVCADLSRSARIGVNNEAHATTDELITQAGGRAIFVETDVSSVDSVEALIQETVKVYSRVDM